MPDETMENFPSTIDVRDLNWKIVGKIEVSSIELRKNFLVFQGRVLLGFKGKIIFTWIFARDLSRRDVALRRHLCIII